MSDLPEMLIENAGSQAMRQRPVQKPDGPPATCRDPSGSVFDLAVGLLLDLLLQPLGGHALGPLDRRAHGPVDDQLASMPMARLTENSTV